MQVSEIRRKFIDYFVKHGHTEVKSSSLVPYNDPTLLFTNAGMNQFKDVFLGLDRRNYTKAVTSQKCVRAGGKHNDLENVGYTARHHTFFEMLGNFSFGDYFKKDAIIYAWEFLVKELAIPYDKLYVTIYHTDDEAYEIWHRTIGLTPERIIRIGDKAGGGSDNFWQMGETGPCGPCTEIFYDHGESVPGGLPGSENEDGDRYIEIWNCVFMQFCRDDKGALNPLPKPSVDTGMGLERISAVLQHVHSNYEIDLFKSLINHAILITKCLDQNNVSLKVLADHIRSIAFLIADGVMPSNEGRGYVLRRIIRRAIRHGYKLDVHEPFLYKLVNALVMQMGESYPELIGQQAIIENTIRQEEERFLQTIETGMALLQQVMTNLPNKILSGNIAFKLYDTYGFPLDLTCDICRELGINVDINGFDLAMDKQRKLAKASGKFKLNKTLDYKGQDTNFSGYLETTVVATIVALYANDEPVDQLNKDTHGIVVLDKTVFYAEGGGQVSDTGIIQSSGGSDCIFVVEDAQRIRPLVVGHLGKVSSGSLKLGDVVTVTYDLHKRLAIARNHSVTHLLHKALHEVIGKQAVQKGSLVSDEYTRFDFSHDKPLTSREIEEVERIVNHVIMRNYEVHYLNMSYDTAIENGAMALFGEKYADDVRVIKMGEFSTELCGGTHVTRTGDIGFFTITSEIGVASGVRRIEAITGEVALRQMQKNIAILDKLRDELKAQTNEIILDKFSALINDNKVLNKELNDVRSSLVLNQATKFLDKVEQLDSGIKLLVLELPKTDNKVIIELVENLKAKIGSGIIVVGVNNLDKVNLVVGVTSDLTYQYKAGTILNYLALELGGKGGGRPDLAQGAGTQIDKLALVLNKVKIFVTSLSEKV